MLHPLVTMGNCCGYIGLGVDKFCMQHFSVFRNINVLIARRHENDMTH